MKWKVLVGILIVVVVAGALSGIKALQISTLLAAAKVYTQPPEVVSSATVKEEKWQDTIEAIGSITAVQGVTITPEIAGIVSEIAFESSAFVEKGDVLIRLDASTEEAQLRAIEAQADLARINAERMRQLRAEQTVSQSELDTALAEMMQHQASADAIRAVIQKKTLRAPFAGKLGIRQVNLGEYVEAGQPIVSLQSLSPLYADFSLPQQELARVKAGLPVRITTDTYPDKSFFGKLTAIDPDLHTGTRSIRLQATLDNPDFLLRPGMFVRAEVLLPSRQEVNVIPATALLSAPYGNSVFVIEQATNTPESLVVRQQFVRTGRTRGDFVSVLTGVEPGVQIVSAGVFKLRNGMPVAINNEIVPRATEQPHPEDK